MGRGGNSADGLGNLADELAAWGDGDADGDEYGYYEEEEESGFVAADPNNAESCPFDGGTNGALSHGAGAASGVNGSATRDSGIDVASSPPRMDTARDHGVAKAQRPQQHQQHRRIHSAYKDCDYGGGGAEEGDLKLADGISAELEARMAAVEGLARRGAEENESAADAIVARVVERLRDLGSQAGVEGGATRYVCMMPFLWMCAALPSPVLLSRKQPLSVKRRS